MRGGRKARTVSLANRSFQVSSHVFVLWFNAVDPKGFLNLLSWKSLWPANNNLWPVRYHDIQVLLGCWRSGTCEARVHTAVLLWYAPCAFQTLWSLTLQVTSICRRDLKLQRQQKNQRRSNTRIIQQAPDDFDMQCKGLAFQPHFHSIPSTHDLDQVVNHNKSCAVKESSQAKHFTCLWLEHEEELSFCICIDSPWLLCSHFT